ncbi:MAG: bacteriohemerythrin [Clostridium neonatale]
MYEMKDEFKTNIEIIDQQHEKLFEITNEAYMLLTNNFKLDKYDEIVGILESLKDYTQFHFETEEKYMESINYKRLFSHKIEHDSFINKLENLDLTHIDSNQDVSIKELLQFLNDWLIDHILQNDKLIGES